MSSQGSNDKRAHPNRLRHGPRQYQARGGYSTDDSESPHDTTQQIGDIFDHYQTPAPHSHAPMELNDMSEASGFDSSILEQQTTENLARRRKSLVRPERHPVDRRYPRRISELEGSDAANRSKNSKHPALERNGSSFRTLKGGKVKDGSPLQKRGRCPSIWQMFATCITFYAPNPVLSCCGMKTKEIRQAWREKMALCTVIILLCLAVGFLTFGFQQVLCGFSSSINRVKHGSLQETDAVINGKVYSLAGYTHPPATDVPSDGKLIPIAGGQDISFMFQNVNSYCKGVLNIQSGADGSGNVVNYFPCIIRNSTTPPNPSDNPDRSGCHRNPAGRAAAQKLKFIGEIYYDWPDIL
ncbi:hypothetical protein K7432_012868, partial [Basidiobolus ranarum]